MGIWSNTPEDEIIKALHAIDKLIRLNKLRSRLQTTLQEKLATQLEIIKKNIIKKIKVLSIKNVIDPFITKFHTLLSSFDKCFNNKNFHEFDKKLSFFHFELWNILRDDLDLELGMKAISESRSTSEASGSGGTEKDSVKNILFYFNYHHLFAAENSAAILPDFFFIINRMKNFSMEVALGQIYLWLKIQLNYDTINTYDGYKEVKEALIKIVSEFEERIAIEAQDSNNEMQQRLFGFIMIRNIQERDKYKDEKDKLKNYVSSEDSKKMLESTLTSYNGDQNYHQAFKNIYDAVLAERKECIDSLILISPDAATTSTAANKPKKETIQKLKALNDQVYKIHDIFEKIAPTVFKNGQAQIDRLISDSLKLFVRYLEESERGKHGRNRRKQIKKFFDGLHVKSTGGKATISDEISPDPAIVPDSSGEEALLRKFVANLTRLGQELEDEDKNSVVRSAKNSKLFKLVKATSERLIRVTRVRGKDDTVINEIANIKKLYEDTRSYSEKSYFCLRNLFRWSANKDADAVSSPPVVLGH